MLSFMQYFTIDFICSYQMTHYPFDIQECTGILESSNAFVELVPKALSYDGPIDLMKYQLIGNAEILQSTNVNILKTKAKEISL